MDKKAKNILLKTYWSSKGWKDEFTTSPDDFLYAKEKGLMFDPVTICHDECIHQIIEVVNSISQEQVVKAFLSSLSTRRLDWRSSIASYHVAKLMTFHHYTPVESGYSYKNGHVVAVSYTCEVCKNLKYGVIGEEKYIKNDVNIFNFERIKWGGVRHGDLLYTLFDLKQFQKEHITEPTQTDITIFKKILNAVDNCQTGDFPSVLRDKLKDISELKSNKDERTGLIEILACIGVLQPASYNRATSSKHDWTFVEYWRGEDGYDHKVVEKYFGKYL